jgi:hypothetical protein
MKLRTFARCSALGLVALVSGTLGSACSGDIGSASPGAKPSSSPASSGPGSRGPGGPGTPGVPTIGGGAGSGPSAACSARLPAPVRRLSHDELAHTLADLFPGLDVGKPTLVPDADMLGFTNRAKLLNASALLVQQYNDLAAGIAAKAVAKLDAVLPCAPTAAGCAEEFVAGFGQRALRRPLTNEERAAFLSHFEAAAAAGSPQARARRSRPSSSIPTFTTASSAASRAATG